MRLLEVVREILKLKFTLFIFILLFNFNCYAARVKADLILINKAERKLTLFNGVKELHSYRVALGPNAEGAKVKQGDGKTPEGEYKISQKNSQSQFYLSLRVSYPEKKDLLAARKLGVSPGGDIMIHGLGPYFRFLGALHWMKDWTAGCIAVNNTEIKEIWDLVDVGTKVIIKP